MTIGELTLQLGVKGADKAVGSLTEVKKGLSETASTSIEAKAAIVGMMYALERLFAASGKAGTDLSNFNAVAGVSVQTLQQYQYAARQVGVSNQEVEGSFKTLQGVMTKTLMGEGAPKGMARVSQLTGGITNADIEKFAKSPDLLIQRLQQYASKEKNVGLRNEVLKSFGLGDGMIASLSRNAYRPEVLAKAPTYSDKEVNSLDKANVAWSNLGNKIEMAFGHFNAAHGGALVSDISKIVDQVVRLAEAFVVLAEKLQVFKMVGVMFKELASLVELGNKGFDKVSGAITDPKKRQALLAEGKNEILQDLSSMKTNLVNKGGSLLHSLGLGSEAAPKMPLLGSGTKEQNNNISINNTFAHPGVDPKKTGDSVKHAIEKTYRQMHAQTQGT